ncbi:amidohydrolase family protein [uncultured Chitinophaga sp.]|uniref:amidohydrolase family protein n=1 Tax=uncultured Chitinophaga sp. TaxID=339340 RepID=UPI0025D293CF|nr:amidohydrolase family protein [uncultured Chitinophaga sp.]
MKAWIKLTARNIFDGHRFLGKDKVLILAPNGVVEAVTDRSEAGEGVREIEGWLSPGLINTHCHLELSHMAGRIPEKTGLPDFLTTVMTTRQPDSPEQIAEAIATAEENMLNSGIVAVGDICNTTNTISQKQKNNLYYHSFIECMGFVDAGAQTRFDQMQAVYTAFRELDAAGIHTSSLVPHAPYSVSAALFGILSQLPQSQPITIHNQECFAENMLYESGTGAFIGFYEHMGIGMGNFRPTGKSSLQSYLPYFQQQGNMLLVHNTFTEEADIQAAHTSPKNIYWCLCPNANIYIEDTLPYLSLFRDNNCVMTIGTDSLASNHQLSVWEEVKTIHEHHADIPLEEIMQWATLNSAKALGVEHTFGSFEKGKRPGVTAIDKESKRVLF